MPISEILWTLLALLLFVCRGLTEYTNNRARLLQEILLSRSSISMKQKRYEGRPYGGNSLTMQQECCPSVTDTIAPRGGISREGTLLELFRDRDMVQLFHETKCAVGVQGSPCNYIDPAHQRHSRCEQKFTYVYGIVKDFNVTQPYRMDYMKLKTACSCTVTVQEPELFPHV